VRPQRMIYLRLIGSRGRSEENLGVARRNYWARCVRSSLAVEKLRTLSMDTKRKIPTLSSYCAILPSVRVSLPVISSASLLLTGQQTLSRDVFHIIETEVICPQMKFENTLNFPFQHVFNGVRDLQSSFERYYGFFTSTCTVSMDALAISGMVALAPPLLLSPALSTSRSFLEALGVLLLW
jgi:hypothetical protein